MISTLRPLPLVDQHTWLASFRADKALVRGQAYQITKRILDLALIFAAIPLLAPLVTLVALLIKLGSPRDPVLFWQYRIGKGGRRFRMLKFRTMVADAERLKRQLAPVNEDGELIQPLKLADDPRITRIGKFLRKTSLDELPQLWNILRGEMSLVGPRPTSFGLKSYRLWHTERLDVLPGLTGLWQLYGRGSTSFDDWLRWDIAYQERRCLMLDIQILVRTVIAVLDQRGAR